MHRDVSLLADMCEEAAGIFRKHSIENWAKWLEKDAGLLRNSDFYGVEHLMSAFGGMGSLSDIGLAEPSPENPPILRTHSDDARLQILIEKIRELAGALHRENC